MIPTAFRHKQIEPVQTLGKALAKPTCSGTQHRLDGDGAGKACRFAGGVTSVYFGHQRSNGLFLFFVDRLHGETWIAAAVARLFHGVLYAGNAALRNDEFRRGQNGGLQFSGFIKIARANGVKQSDAQLRQCAA